MPLSIRCCDKNKSGSTSHHGCPGEPRKRQKQQPWQNNAGGGLGERLLSLAAAGRSRSRGNSANNNSPLPGLLAPLCVGGGDTNTVAAGADAVAGLSRCHGRLPQRGLRVLPLFSSAVAAAAAVGAVATVTDRDLAPSAPPPGAPRAGCAAHPPRALVCCLPASCGPKKNKNDDQRADRPVGGCASVRRNTRAPLLGSRASGVSFPFLPFLPFSLRPPCRSGFFFFFLTRGRGGRKSEGDNLKKDHSVHTKQTHVYFCIRQALCSSAAPCVVFLIVGGLWWKKKFFPYKAHPDTHSVLLCSSARVYPPCYPSPSVPVSSPSLR